jgi:hypothetical protein
MPIPIGYAGYTHMDPWASTGSILTRVSLQIASGAFDGLQQYLSSCRIEGFSRESLRNAHAGKLQTVGIFDNRQFDLCRISVPVKTAVLWPFSAGEPQGSSFESTWAQGGASLGFAQVLKPLRFGGCLSAGFH